MDNIKCMRKAIKYKYDELSEILPTKIIIPKLFSNGIISLEEKQRLDCEGKNHGQISEAKGCLDCILKKSDNELLLSVKLVEECAPAIYQVLIMTVKALNEGIITTGILNTEDLKNHLRKMYLENQDWSSVETIPGELRVDVSNEALLMTPVFTAEKYVQSSKMNTGIFLMGDNNTHSPYEVTDIKEIDQLFGKEYVQALKMNRIPKDVLPNLFICTGNPGVGKTTLTHMITLQWAKGNSLYLEHFEAVFLIPLRDIKFGSLYDILKHIQLLPEKTTKEDLDDYFETAKHVLFIVDGLDEVDVPDEVIQLIKGNFLPRVTVFVTSRPEAELFRSKCVVKPMVKVFLHGTDEESVQRFISTTLGDTMEAKKFYVTCKNTLTDIHMLFVPLYLTLMSFVLKDTLGLHTSITGYKVPHTATEIFNAFLTVIVKRWLRRQGRTSDIDQPFSKCPIGKPSAYPKDIQRILYFIGKMCFFGLRTHKYEFMEDEIDGFYLDIKDVWNCGLFDKVTKKECIFYSLRHKQMQEYLAAAYLIEEEETHELLSILPWNNSKYQDDHPLTVAEYCAKYNMVKTFQFVVGFAPELTDKLLSSSCHSKCVKKSPVDGSIDIYFEASLFKETNSLESVSTITNHLLSSKLLEVESGFTNYLETASLQNTMLDQFEFGSYENYQKSLQCFLETISPKDSLEMLEKWYNIKLQPVTDSIYELVSPGENRYWYKKLLSPDKLETCRKDELTFCMDQVSMVLLSKFAINNVVKLCVRSCHMVYLDLPKIKSSLALVKELDILGRSLVTTVKDIQSPIATNFPISIEKLTLSTAKHCTLSQTNVEFILSQELLQSLCLIQTNMFANLNQSTPIVFQYLKEVIINDSQANSKQVTTLCQLIKGSQNIEKLRVWCSFSEKNLDLTQLIDCLKCHTKLLKTFFLGLYPHNYMETVVCEAIPFMTGVNHIGVHFLDVQAFIHDFINAILSNPSIKRFTLYDHNQNGGRTGYTLPSHYKGKLNEKGVSMEVKTPETYITAEDQVNFIKQW